MWNERDSFETPLKKIIVTQVKTCVFETEIVVHASATDNEIENMLNGYSDSDGARDWLNTDDNFSHVDDEYVNWIAEEIPDVRREPLPKFDQTGHPCGWVYPT